VEDYPELVLKKFLIANNFNASLTYSKSMNKSKMITSDKQENKMIYFELGMEI
jgi:hypothetical protein